jgi:hypothetical protein
MPTFPGLVTSGSPISSAWGNGIRNALIATYGEIYAWTTDVDANGGDLADLGSLTFNAAGGIADGSTSAPGLPFLSDPNTGIHRSGADTVDVVTGGVSRATISPLSSQIRAGSFHRWSIFDLTIADDASVSLTTMTGGANAGTLWMVNNDGVDVSGAVLVRGGLDQAVEIYDLFTTIMTTDTDGSFCVFPAGSGAYTLRNRRGSSQTFGFMFMGR